jgi:hypothetical protein
MFGCITAAMAIFTLYTYITSGQWPNMAELALYTKLFYFYGYFMLPMRPIHPWHILVLTYIIGLFLSISYLLDKNGYTYAYVSRDPKDHAFYKLIFALSVLGIGLFNYFVGRSHDFSLVPLTWVALVILTLFTDRLLTGLSRTLYAHSLKWCTKAILFFRHNDKVFFFLVLFFFFCSSALSIFPYLYSLQVLSRTRLSSVAKGMPSALNSQIQFIRSTSHESDPVFILSDYAPELYLYSRHIRPLNVPGFGELALRDDTKQINDYLSNPPINGKIYWNPGFTFNGLSPFTNLALAGSSEDGGLFLLKSKGR